MLAVPFNLTGTDLVTLAMTDEEFVPDTWNDVQNAIAATDLSTLPRSPSILRRYINWAQKIKEEYGSTAEFVLQQRLSWKSAMTAKNPTPFAEPSDYKILYNDWPYGLTPDITHLVIWLKTPLSVDMERGEMTAESRAILDEFVEKTFTQRMRPEGVSQENVIFFKNVPRLQSVGAIEHVHVLLRGAREEHLEEWTNGDVPMYKR